MIVWQTYTPAGQRDLIVRVGAGTGHFYDGIGRLNLLGQDFAGPLHDVTWTLARNPASQIVSDYRSADVVWTGHYAVNRAYTANGLNQYSTAGAANFTYDANGNLTSDGSRTYTYDVENRLVGASGGLVLAYDPLGRLHQTSGGASGTTRFLYDGDALVGEYGEGGNVLLRRYAHGRGIDEPWLWYEGAEVSPATRRQLAADPQGSIAAIADGTGNRLAVNRYDEYGIPAATNMGRFQHTGQIWLPDLGMYHYKARVYSPTLGRFLQVDPIGYDDQFNLYAYVGNDPVNTNDPSGLRSEYSSSCNTAGSRLCTAARDAAGRQEIRQARENFRAAQTMRNLASLGPAGLVVAILSIPGDTPVDNRTSAERFDDAFLEATDQESSGRRVGFHYTTQEGAEGIAASGTIQQNRGRTYFTNEPFSPPQAQRNVFLNAPTHAGRGESVVVFSYDPRSFPALPDPSTPVGRVHPGSIRNGRETVRFHYVGPNQFGGR